MSNAALATPRPLAGWGNYPTLRTELAGGTDADALAELVRRRPSLVARGNGRSYGDSALNPVCVASTLGLNRILAFDRDRGRITVEAGLLLGDLLAVVVPAGWFVPVTPGTRFVTLGGMLAADVHGKGLGAPGFGAHVEAFTLLLASGERVRVDPESDRELFRATVGGMGLTGIVLDLTFTLIPLASAWLEQETVAAPSLDDLLALFEGPSERPYAVAWIDCLARGARRGRAVFGRGRHLDGDELPAAVRHPPRRRRLTVPFFLPGGTLNGVTVRLFNEAYYRHGRGGAGTAVVDYGRFFHPLDNIGAWNRIYGRRGFVQYQCVLPRAHAARGLDILLQRIAAAGRGSFLAVLKRLGEDPSGYLAFPMDGYTLALDFPRAPGVFALLDELDRIVLAHGGRLYLAKDARAAPAVVAAGYPELPAFRDARARIDPEERFTSRQAVRLGL